MWQRSPAFERVGGNGGGWPAAGSDEKITHLEGRRQVTSQSTELAGSAFHVLPERVVKLGAMLVEDAARGALDFLDQAVEVIAGAGDGHHANGGRLPGDGFIHFGNRDIEALAQLVLEGADHLTPVLEGLGVLDADFERELSDGHGFGEQLYGGMGWDCAKNKTGMSSELIGLRPEIALMPGAGWGIAVSGPEEREAVENKNGDVEWMHRVTP